MPSYSRKVFSPDFRPVPFCLCGSVPLSPCPHPPQPKTLVGGMLQAALPRGSDYFRAFATERVERLSDERSRQREELKHVSFGYVRLCPTPSPARRWLMEGESGGIVPLPLCPTISAPASASAACAHSHAGGAMVAEKRCHRPRPHLARLSVAFNCFALNL